MKSPSEYFIIEKTDPTKYVPGEEEASERLVKKLNKIKKKGNIPDKLPYADPSVSDKPESVKNQMAKNIAKQDIEKNSGRESGRIGSEGSGKVKDTVKPEQAKGYKSTEKVKLDNSTSGSSVRSNKAQKKPLGKVVGRVTPDRKTRGLKIGDIDRKDSKQLEAQRKARIDTKRNLPSGQPNPKYGKATQKGVENFAQNRGGYGRGRKLSGDEWKKISGSAKEIASDPSSKAYKDIETKINQNRDYGGKRAKVMNPNQISQVKKEISKSKTVNTKGGKLTIQRTSKLLDTKTRKGRIANVSSTPPTPTRQPGTRYSVKGPGSSTGSLSKGNIKFSGDDVYNDLKKKIKTTDGRSTNRPTPTPKKFTTFRQGNLFGGNQSPSSTTQGFRPNNTPDPNIIKKPKNYNPDQGVLDFNKKNTTVIKQSEVSKDAEKFTQDTNTKRIEKLSRRRVKLNYDMPKPEKDTVLRKVDPPKVKTQLSPDTLRSTNPKSNINTTYDKSKASKASKTSTKKTFKDILKNTKARITKTSSKFNIPKPPSTVKDILNTKTKTKVTPPKTKKITKTPNLFNKVKGKFKLGTGAKLTGVGYGIDTYTKRLDQGATQSRAITDAGIQAGASAATWQTIGKLTQGVSNYVPGPLKLPVKLAAFGAQIYGTRKVATDTQKLTNKILGSPKTQTQTEFQKNKTKTKTKTKVTTTPNNKKTPPKLILPPSGGSTKGSSNKNIFFGTSGR